MEFQFKKATHLFALLGVIASFFLFILYPVISIFFSTPIPSIYSPQMSSMQKMVIEITLLLVQFILVIAGMILVPLLWYTLVNRLSLQQMFVRLQLRREGLGNALAWGFIAVICAFGVTIIIGYAYIFISGINPDEVSNIPDLEKIFSISSLYILVTLQPFCEEFFFRGFLLEKISSAWGNTIAIITTSLLFGISHLSYTYTYTAFLAVVLGLLFAVLVIKTKNLYSAVFAHTVINVVSLTLYFLGQSFGL